VVVKMLKFTLSGRERREREKEKEREREDFEK